MAELVCQSCGRPVGIAESIPRDATCDGCGKDLRCCRNCRHFDERYSNHCTETQAEPVTDKSRQNFCEYFYFSQAAFARASAGRDRAAEARAKLEALFKKRSPDAD